MLKLMSARPVSPHSATISPRWRTSPLGPPRGATLPMIWFHGGGSGEAPDDLGLDIARPRRLVRRRQRAGIEPGLALRGAPPRAAMRRRDILFIEGEWHARAAGAIERRSPASPATAA